ncbi:MAG: hypothetical protein O1I36_17785, partial [Cylindrospermopsis raciborskii PAMP2011]|nr:hypothetical protein [Cylindrospermopsis raciborskii PAMP2011]
MEHCVQTYLRLSDLMKGKGPLKKLIKFFEIGGSFYSEATSEKGDQSYRHTCRNDYDKKSLITIIITFLFYGVLDQEVCQKNGVQILKRSSV